MTKEQFAAMLNGREYTKEISGPEAQRALDLGYVVMFGGSDDLAIVHGATVNTLDELGAYDGGFFRLAATPEGKAFEIKDPDSYGDALELLKTFGFYEQAKFMYESAAKVEFLWDKNGYSWFVNASVPFAPFDIFDSGELFCRGIVIDVRDLPATGGAK